MSPWPVSWTCLCCSLFILLLQQPTAVIVLADESNSGSVEEHRVPLESNYAIQTNSRGDTAPELIHRFHAEPLPLAASQISSNSLSPSTPAASLDGGGPNALLELGFDDNIQKALQRDFGPSGFESEEFQRIYRGCGLHQGWGTSKRVNNFMANVHCLHCAEHACESQGEIYALVAVHSHTRNLRRRQLIRETWGSVRMIGARRLAVIFFVGLSSEHQADLDVEVKQHKDIVQVSVEEHYRNLTYKHVAIMEWMMHHCRQAKYLVKADDDTFIDVFHLFNFLPYYTPDGFLCHIIHSKPMRNPQTKWYISVEEFSPRAYPIYCEGFGYIVEAAKARDLFWCSMFTRFIWIDDVFVSGVLADRLHYRREALWDGHSFDRLTPAHMSSPNLSDSIFLIARDNSIFPEIFFKIWRHALRLHIS